MRAELLSDAGAGSALVYVPGIDGTGELLLGTAAELEAHWRLLRLRYRTGGEDSYPGIARSIQAILDAQGVAKATLIAESFGVGVALQTALLEPDRVRALMLVNGFCRYHRRVRLALSRCFAPLVQGPLFRIGRRTLGTMLMLGSQASRDEVREFHTLPGTIFDQGYRRRLGLIARLDLRGELPRLGQPVAIVASTKDRIVDARRSAREMAELLPDARVRELEGAGHIVLPLARHPWVQWIEELEARARE